MENKEQTLITINEALSNNKITIEQLNKIKFLITSGYANPHQIRINPSTGAFLNIETTDVYEIKRNQDTQKFEIYKNNQLDYTESTSKEKNNPKVRILTKEDPKRLNNAAFTRISFLVLNTISILILMGMTILLIK